MSVMYVLWSRDYVDSIVFTIDFVLNLEQLRHTFIHKHAHALLSCTVHVSRADPQLRQHVLAVHGVERGQSDRFFDNPSQIREVDISALMP